MIKVTVKKDGVVTNQAIWPSQAEAETWVASCEADKAFGMPSHEILDENGQPTGVWNPAEYTVEYTDVTAELEAKKASDEAKAYLAATDWMVIREMDSGVACPAEVKAARAEARTKVL